jgi:pimeloyl-ACP methyl ester carboxylesterase
VSGHLRDFRWLERGEGEPVVLLHGLMGQMHHWDPTLDVLAEGARALAPMLPLFERSWTDLSIEALARWVVDFLDALDLGPAVVVATRSVATSRWPRLSSLPSGWPVSC